MAQAALLGHSISVNAEIIQWHWLLGHPSFSILERVNQILFK